MNLQPLETPPLRVSRPVAACSRCRNAKIKCDGKLPACTSCEKNGRAAECTSTNDQFARGKERSYVSTLETRIDKLETKIRDAQARKPSVVDETPVQSRRPSEQIQAAQRQRAAAQQDEVPTPTTGRRQKRREVSAIDDLVSDFGFLSVNATARDFHGFTQAMSYARLILWSCTKDELPKGTTQALPVRSDGIRLIEFYINNIFALLPAFEEASLWTAFENVYSKGSRISTHFDHWIVRMIFAIANASMSRRSGDQYSLESISHVCAALEYSEQVLHPGNISGVQALLLLAKFAMLTPHHFDSWQLIGAASRAMTDLGYHQDPPRGSQMDRNQLELRRKVFHCIYVLDRSTSLVQTRAFSFSDASANVKVPFSRPQGKVSTPQETTAASPSQTWMQSYEQAADLVELRKIQSEWYTTLFQTSRDAWNEPYPELWKYCNEMRKWFDSLSPSTPKHMREFFELDLYYSYVYVLSPSTRVPRVHPFAQKLIFEYCIHYTDLMLRLNSDPHYTGPLTFYDAMRVYMTGRQFIDVLDHSMDMLLSGAVPQHPDVKATAAPPPAMPVVPLPPGETLQRFTICRAINCIKQTMECMKRFGVRWGYMSWHQRYEHETKPALDNLEQRLHIYDETNRARQMSTWSANGSITSSTGTMAYYSPPQTMSQGLSMYQQQTPPQMPPKQSSYGESAATQQTSPPMFQQQPSMQHRQQYPVQQGPPYPQMQLQYQQTPQAQPVTFTNPTYPQPSVSATPGQQFASWSGYGASTGGPDTLDEENAASNRMNTNQSARSMVSPRASRGSIQQPLVQHRPSNYVATFESRPRSSIAPGPRSSVAPGPAHVSINENMGPWYRQSLQHNSGLNIPPPANMPFRGQTEPAQPPETALMPPPPPPPRRTSMQDASQDLMRTTYPPAIPAPTPQPFISRQSSPRIFSPSRRRRDKGKAKALFTPRPPPPAGEFVGQCRWNPGLGYICELCARLCVVPALHRANLDGSGCTDLSGWGATLAEDVAQDVARDPERAASEAEVAGAVMAGLMRRQVWDEWEGKWMWVLEPSQWQQWYAPQQIQQWVPMPAPPGGQYDLGRAPQPLGGAATGLAGHGRLRASTSAPNFTSLSQMQQWGMEQAGPSRPAGWWQGG